MIQVRKASGVLEPFSEEKVILALKRAGIDQNFTETILAGLKKELYDGIPTQGVYSHIVEFLKKEDSPNFGRFILKKAIMDLGPSGFPFEKFFGALLRNYGYTIEIGVSVSGRCVKHEIDVVAEKDNKHFMVECKFHNHQGIYSDIKVALYVKARFDDVEVVWKEKPGHQVKFHQAWLVTNTKLTSDAIQYGECVGMRMIGWNYPNKGALRDLIENSGLHPITCLSSLSNTQKQMLISNGIVLCKEFLTLESSALRNIDLSERQVEKIKGEIEQLCILPQTQEKVVV